MHKSCKSQCLTYKYINHSFYTHTQTKCIIKWKNYYIVEIETIFLSENTTNIFSFIYKFAKFSYNKSQPTTTLQTCFIYFFFEANRFSKILTKNLPDYFLR